MKKGGNKGVIALLSTALAVSVLATAGHFTANALLGNYNKAEAEPDSKSEQILDDIEGNIGGGTTDNSGNPNGNQSGQTKPEDQTSGNNNGEQNENGNSSDNEQNTQPTEPEQPTEPTLTATTEFANVIATLKQVREAAESLSFDVKGAVKTINEQKPQIEALKAKYPQAADLYAQANTYVETLEKVVYSSAIKQGVNLATGSDYYQIDATQFGADEGMGKLYVNNAKNLYAVETPNYLSYVDNSCFYNYDLLSGKSSTQNKAEVKYSQVDFVKDVLTTGSAQLINDESTVISYSETEDKDSAYSIVLENDKENQHLNFVFAEEGNLKTFEGKEVEGKTDLTYKFTDIDQKTFTTYYEAILDRINDLSNSVNI